ncbi:MAG TPA: PQQ-dependent sugar dehydrogenase [Candidatus Saccharimonadales bacterium]|nr:PQQ-dependent sugar dehydrogenase [Candidatus Saccharimonadales bacterium]
MISIISNNHFLVIEARPVVYDKTLKLEKVVGGMNYPVSMSFLGPDEIIFLEKNSGYVNRIINGQIIDEPLLKIKVDHRLERGLLGSAVAHNASGNTYVFLYFTKNNISLLNGTTSNFTENNLYRYDFVNGKLLNPKLLYKVPTEEHYIHNGGKIVVGPDNNLYLMVGDLFTYKHKLSGNYPQGSIDGTGGIIRLTFDGLPVKGIVADTYPLNLYYAYGIRNGFGMDFDPVTGNLWDTENGPNYGDEINLVQPGFNSGWKKVQGIWQPYIEWGEGKGQVFANFSQLVTFNDKGRYSPPEYIWEKTIGVTPIMFLNSTNLGSNYTNDMFVGDYKNGSIYHFDLNYNRTKIIDNHAVVMKEANNEEILIHSQRYYPGCLKEFICSVIPHKNTNSNSSSVLVTSTLSASGSGSSIEGKEFDVSPQTNYTITTSIKLNNQSTQANIKIEGYNNETRLWEPISYCISNSNGPIEWTRFDCTIKVPDNISKIKPIINGGYSITAGKEALSYFTNIGIEDGTEFVDLFPDIHYTGYGMLGKGFGHITDMQVGADGNIYVLSLLRADDPERTIDDENIREGVIYRISKN